MPQCDINFEGRAILVTGGGRGLGRAQSLLLASRGANVVVSDNGTAMDGNNGDAAPAQAVVNEIHSAGGKAVACIADIATEAGSSQVVASCLEAFGRIDGVIHYASTSPDPTPPDEMSFHDLDLVMRVNPMAALWMLRAAWPHMVAQGYGRIVVTPSAALYGALGNAHYAAAKSAYIGMLRCLALDGANHNIYVNGIMPAARTRMTERLQPSAFKDWFLETMTPEKVTTGAAFLLSEACTVNGEIFAMGGGRIARVVIAETRGAVNAGTSIESVRDAMPQIMAESDFFYPSDLSERSVKVNQVLGFQGGLNASSAYAVKTDSND